MPATARHGRRPAGIARDGLDSALTDFNLDAVIALTGHPAWLTDTCSVTITAGARRDPAAVSGYPSITGPGRARERSAGRRFLHRAGLERARLIGLAHAFELPAPAA